ncbi:hypothetical protein EVAR_46838_1 [Eumeta japonica]|uniref:Uncharacterized protein n=1 Tax=Eumeta variegata TaxID=151549 RepID=A0A4C1XR28_EUMVA|nr:hypothetical protein EVAR_46838_1 [Eumeta japonica]
MFYSLRVWSCSSTVTSRVGRVNKRKKYSITKVCKGAEQIAGSMEYLVACRGRCPRTCSSQLCNLRTTPSTSSLGRHHGARGRAARPFLITLTDGFQLNRLKFTELLSSTYLHTLQTLKKNVAYI